MNLLREAADAMPKGNDDVALLVMAIDGTKVSTFMRGQPAKMCEMFAHTVFDKGDRDYDTLRQVLAVAKMATEAISGNTDDNENQN